MPLEFFIQILYSRLLYRNSSSSREVSWDPRSSVIVPYNNSNSVGTRSSSRSSWTSRTAPFVGLTLPAADSVGGSATGVYCVSTVPSFSSSTAAAGLTETREFHNWSIQIQSTNFEHVSNGMTARLLFTVFSSKEINKIAITQASDADELPSAAGAAMELLPSSASVRLFVDFFSMNYTAAFTSVTSSASTAAFAFAFCFYLFSFCFL